MFHPRKPPSDQSPSVATDPLTTGSRRLVDERIMARACLSYSATRLWSRKLTGRDLGSYVVVDFVQGVVGMVEGNRPEKNGF